jgi:hypothetical protein
MVREAFTMKVDEATTVKANEVEAVKADERAAPVDTGKAAAEAALTLPQTEDQAEGHGEEREVHTISLDEPPRPHGKVAIEAEVPSITEMAAPGVPEG